MPRHAQRWRRRAAWRIVGCSRRDRRRARARRRRARRRGPRARRDDPRGRERQRAAERCYPPHSARAANSIAHVEDELLQCRTTPHLPRHTASHSASRHGERLDVSSICTAQKGGSNHTNGVLHSRTRGPRRLHALGRADERRSAPPTKARPTTPPNAVGSSPTKAGPFWGKARETRRPHRR